MDMDMVIRVYLGEWSTQHPRSYARYRDIVKIISLKGLCTRTSISISSAYLYKSMSLSLS
jgi:hypothetical protein